MSTTVALARIFALYLVIAGLSLLLNRRFFKAVLKDLTQSHIAMMLIGIMTLIMGCVLITLHNHWQNGWQCWVSTMCWLTFIAGVVRTLFPSFIMRLAPKILTHDRYFYYGGIISIIIGGIFGYYGFLIF